MQAAERITLGGGCFWCTEAVFERVRGVQAIVCGYANGALDNPSYEQVCGGDTGHAEVVQLTFDSAVISQRQVLEIFFATHDPTQLNRQGNDVGTQYRSCILYSSPEQQQVAAQLLQELAPTVVTLVEPLQQFWPAEAYHQQYYQKHPQQGYCAAVIQPKVQKFRQTFVAFLTPGD